MNDLDQYVGDLLEQTVGEPPRPIDATTVCRRARRQRRTLAGVSTTLAAAVALAVTLPLVLVGNGASSSEEVIAPPSPQPSAPTTYTLDAPLVSASGTSLKACLMASASIPAETDCTGVPVEGDVDPGSLPTAKRVGEGSVVTGPLHLVGHWKDHALVLDQPPAVTDHVTVGAGPDCPAPTGGSRALVQRIENDFAVLSGGGVDVLSVGPCAGNAAIMVPVADKATVSFLEARYEHVVVYGWLVPVKAKPTTTPAVVPADAPFTVEDRIDVDGAPVQMVATDTGLFVTTCCKEGGGRTLSISRIDPASGRVTATVDRGDVRGLALAGEYLWASVGGDAERPTIVAMDPANLAVRRTVNLPGPASTLAAAGGRLWAAGQEALYSIDPATGTVQHTVHIDNPYATSGGFPFVAAAPDGAVLWTSEGRPGGGPVKVQVRDPRTGNVIASTDNGTGSANGAQIAAADDHAWLGFPTGMLGSYSRVDIDGTRLRPMARAATGEDDRPFANGITVHLADGQLWILDAMSGSVACADETTGRIIARSRVDGLGSSLAVLGPNRLSVGAGDKVLIVQPKPVCAA